MVECTIIQLTFFGDHHLLEKYRAKLKKLEDDVSRVLEEEKAEWLSEKKMIFEEK